MSIRNAWSWFRSRFEAQPDPQFDKWLWWAGQQVMTQLAERRSAFKLEESLASIQADPRYGAFIADRSYRLFLKKAWADLEVTDKERKTLQWIASTLGIQSQEARDIDLYTAKQVFGAALKKALADGQLDAEEVHRLTAISKNVDLTLRDMARAFLSEDGQVFLDEIAGMASADGGISDAQWKSVLRTIDRLGLSEGDFLETLRPQSERLVSDVVSRAAADGELTPSETACLKSLADRLNLDRAAREQIDAATRRLTTVTILKAANIHEVANAFNSRPYDAVIELNSGEPETGDVSYAMKSLRAAAWWKIERAESAASKYHGGAGTLIERRRAQVSASLPRGLRSNSGYCNISMPHGAFCFLPNGVLLVRDARASGVDFHELECAKARFISNEHPGPGATVVGQTWQYVNKSGGPDSRFRENPQIPVYLMAQIDSPRFEISLQASDSRVAEQVESLKKA